MCTCTCTQPTLMFYTDTGSPLIHLSWSVFSYIIPENHLHVLFKARCVTHFWVFLKHGVVAAAVPPSGLHFIRHFVGHHSNWKKTPGGISSCWPCKCNVVSPDSASDLSFTSHFPHTANFFILRLKTQFLLFPLHLPGIFLIHPFGFHHFWFKFIVRLIKY